MVWDVMRGYLNKRESIAVSLCTTLQVADELVREMADSEKAGLGTTEGVSILL